jgi:hypothetical protein
MKLHNINSFQKAATAQEEDLKNTDRTQTTQQRICLKEVQTTNT